MTAPRSPCASETRTGERRRVRLCFFANSLGKSSPRGAVCTNWTATHALFYATGPGAVLGRALTVCEPCARFSADYPGRTATVAPLPHEIRPSAELHPNDVEYLSLGSLSPSSPAAEEIEQRDAEERDADLETGR